MEMKTANRIADYFIGFSHDVGDPISNLKLQKLLYYAQAWHLALYDSPLFSEKIEAWVHGPAVPEVYRRFKGWAWQPIGESPSKPRLSVRAENHVHEVMRKYGPMTAYQLELLTHRERPWREARRGIAPDEPSHAVISKRIMRDFYRARLRVKGK